MGGGGKEEKQRNGVGGWRGGGEDEKEEEEDGKEEGEDGQEEGKDGQEWGEEGEEEGEEGSEEGDKHNRCKCLQIVADWVIVLRCIIKSQHFFSYYFYLYQIKGIKQRCTGKTIIVQNNLTSNLVMELDAVPDWQTNRAMT